MHGVDELVAEASIIQSSQINRQPRHAANYPQSKKTRQGSKLGQAICSVPLPTNRASTLDFDAAVLPSCVMSHPG
jgi:hypothetical protein